jgi:hypothetical protein
MRKRMKNLSDLKKTLVLGREVEMLTYNGTTPPEKLRGTREVVKVQTNGVWLAPFPESKNRRSWFDFPKATDLEIHTTKHFTITDRTKDGDIWLKREYLIKN